MKLSIPGLSLSALILALFTPTAHAQPEVVYLTWQGDTGTTMTVNFLTENLEAKSVVFYDTEPRHGKEEAYQFQTAGRSHLIPGLEDWRRIHWVELTGLEPGQTYYFIAGDPDNGFSEERKFRIIAADAEKLRFVTGGDMGTSEEVWMLNRNAAALEPDFAIVGGDIAYANAQLRNSPIWEEWLQHWSDEMITPKGYTIPSILAIGNHEVQGSYKGTPEDAPFYFGLFAQAGQKSYFRRQFGKLMPIYILDTDHVYPYESQVDWLEEHMKNDQDFPYRFAVYHVPLYPSYRPLNGSEPTTGRKTWGPLFDEYKLTASFENHDHTFKRSKILNNEAVADDGEGVLYLGDGAWGRHRGIYLDPRWYLEKRGSVRHFWAVDVSTEGVEYRAIDVTGHVFDVYPADAALASDADLYFQNLEMEYDFDPNTVTASPLLTANPVFTKDNLVVTVTNRESFPAEAALSLETGTGIRVKPAKRRLSLFPGESKTAKFTLAASEAMAPEAIPPVLLNYDIDYMVGETTVKNQGTKNLAVEALRRAGTPGSPVTIDGNLDDWDGLPNSFLAPVKFGPGFGTDLWYPYPVITDPYDKTDDWDGANDASLKFGVSHDDDFLYIAVAVTDDDIRQQEDELSWSRDSVVFWADIFPGGECDDDPLFAVSPGKTPDGSGLIKIDRIPEGTRAARTLTDAGYNVEVAIPMSYFLKLRSSRGGGTLDHVRLNFGITDIEGDMKDPALLLWRPQWEEGGDYDWSGVFQLD